MNPALLATISAAAGKSEAGKERPALDVGEGAGWAVLLWLLGLTSIGASAIALMKYVA